MKDDRAIFEERIEALRKLDSKSSTYEKLYMLTMIMSAIHNWGVIDPMINTIYTKGE